MPKTYNIHLTELLFGSFPIEAKNKADASRIAKKMIEDGEVPSGEMKESEGYKLDAVVEEND